MGFCRWPKSRRSFMYEEAHFDISTIYISNFHILYLRIHNKSLTGQCDCEVSAVFKTGDFKHYKSIFGYND